jgi:hypothetical protein
MTQRLYHICGGRIYVSDSSLHVHRHISAAHHQRYRRFYKDELCRQLLTACPGCGKDLFEAEAKGLLRSLTGEPDIGKAIRRWQKNYRRPGASPPAGVPAEPEGIPVTPRPNAGEPDTLRLTTCPVCATMSVGKTCVPPAAQSPTHHEEKPNVTAIAPSAPAEPPAAPPPPARKLLARLSGQSGAGQSVVVSMEQSTSPAGTVFLNISTDGVDGPVEKFLGVQKSRANARLLAIKKELRAATLERFDEPEPEPAPPAPAPKPAAQTRGKQTTPPAPARGKATGKGKPAPAAPTAPVRTRDQITVIKALGRYSALMVVGPNSRYEVVKDYGTPSAERVWEVKATRAWQPQQRAAKEEVDRRFALDPSELPAAELPAAELPAAEPPAAEPPVAEPPVAELPVAELPAAEPPAEPAKAATKKPAPKRAKKATDDGPAL